jgi:hypothetical protein
MNLLQIFRHGEQSLLTVWPQGLCMDKSAKEDGWDTSPIYWQYKSL